mmetsp:Transcript_1973/g.4518  ORF Transcript_1973/g.4518 Transcript_1973/m.4518 type:complete len:209 (+) Transcript_1973:1110-1736(+)
MKVVLNLPNPNQNHKSGQPTRSCQNGQDHGTIPPLPLSIGACIAVIDCQVECRHQTLIPRLVAFVSESTLSYNLNRHGQQQVRKQSLLYVPRIHHDNHRRHPLEQEHVDVVSFRMNSSTFRLNCRRLLLLDIRYGSLALRHSSYHQDHTFHHLWCRHLHYHHHSFCRIFLCSLNIMCRDYSLHYRHYHYYYNHHAFRSRRYLLSIVRP